jgi:Na+/H+-dicarboxylate symporter
MSNRFTQYILIAMALGIIMGALIFNYLPDTRADLAADINLIAMLFLRLIKMIIAPLVFATLVGGIAIWPAARGSDASSPRPWAGSSAPRLCHCCSGY